MTALPLQPSPLARTRNALRAFAAKVAQGFFLITHSSLALIGLALVLVAAALVARPDLRTQGEARLMDWLQARQSTAEEPIDMAAADEAAANGLDAEPQAIDRATALHPHELPREQAQVAYWLSKKYSVAPEPISALVAAAYEVGSKARLDPALILAVMAVESSFNPFAQSHVGAQGLMQVMTRVHSDKYEGFGGKLAAFDPVTNLRVGVKVLQECIARAGSLQGGLKYYVGAANQASDGGYADKVMAEYARIYQVAKGQPLALPSKAAPAIMAVSPAAGAPAAATAPSKAAMAQAGMAGMGAMSGMAGMAADSKAMVSMNASPVAALALPAAATAGLAPNPPTATAQPTNAAPAAALAADAAKRGATTVATL